MKKQLLFVANWKMNMPFKEAIKFATNHYEGLVKLASQPNISLSIAPSHESLYPLVQMFKETKLSITAQNCSAHTGGSFTGQISPESLKQVGCSHCIIGHSEIEKEFGDTPQAIAQKCIHLLDHDITPIICVGETEQEFKNGQTLDSLKQKIGPILEALNNKTTIHPYLTPCIAYEPVWAVGTNNVAPTDHIDMVVTWIQNLVKKETPSIEWKLIYGGSVTEENIAEIKKIPLVGGFLIGKASLDFQIIEKLVQ